MKICPCCGKEYEYRRGADPSFMKSYCSENCKKIFNVASAVSFGHIDVPTAKKELKDLNTDGYETFARGVSDTLIKVLGASQPTVEQKTDDK